MLPSVPIAMPLIHSLVLPPQSEYQNPGFTENEGAGAWNVVSGLSSEAASFALPLDTSGGTRVCGEARPFWRIPAVPSRGELLKTKYGMNVERSIDTLTAV